MIQLIFPKLIPRHIKNTRQIDLNNAAETWRKLVDNG